MTWGDLPDKTARGLRQLARWHGVLTSCVDMSGRRQNALPESLLAVLRALGVGTERMRDVPEALHETRLTCASRVVGAFHVVWQGRRATVPLQLPDWASVGPLRCEWRFKTAACRDGTRGSNGCQAAE